MPARSKLSSAQKKLKLAEDNKELVIQGERELESSDARTSENGTIISGPFMLKPEGVMYFRVIEKRSRKHSVMKWRRIS